MRTTSWNKYYLDANDLAHCLQVKNILNYRIFFWVLYHEICFLVNNALCHLQPEGICFMMSYSKENYIVQYFFSLWTMPYKEHFEIAYHITYFLIRSWFDTLFIIWFEYFESNQFIIRASNQSLKQFVIHTRSTNHEASHMSTYIFWQMSHTRLDMLPYPTM